MKKLIAIIALLISPAALAAPSISGFSGILAHGQSVTFSGANFGTKSPAAPIAWADFESSIEPTALGQKTAWDLNEFMTRNGTAGYNGSGGAVGNGDNVSPSAYTLRLDGQFAGDGQQMYIFRRSKFNFPMNAPVDNGQNTKIWRGWFDGSYPNCYISINNGRVFCEDQSTPDTGFFTGDINAFQTSNTWVAEEILATFNTAVDVKDGSLSYRVNGSELGSGSIMNRFGARTGRLNQNYVVHWVFANTGSWTGGWSNSNTVYNDDVYVDYTFARVMVGNASTLSACTKLAPQIPSAWSGTSATVLMQLPSNDFPAASSAYAYVCDSSNSCSPGYAFTVGGSGGGGGSGSEPPADRNIISDGKAFPAVRS